MQISYLSVRDLKLPRVMGGYIGSRKEICESSGLLIPMVPCLYQSNGYMKRKLRAWRVQKCIALVGADTVLISAGPQYTPCHGGVIYSPERKYANLQAYQSPMVPHLHQSNGYIERKLRSWRVHKCIDLVGADTVLTSAWPQTTPFLGG